MFEWLRTIPALMCVWRGFKGLLGQEAKPPTGRAPVTASSKGRVRFTFLGARYEKEWDRKADYRGPPPRRRK